MFALLRSVPLFSDLSEADLERLCEMVEEVRLPAGEVLFHEGDTGDKAYVIKGGKLEIVKHSGGREVLLAVRTRGEVIGEMSLLEDAPRMASARARGDTVLLAIDKAQINHLVSTSTSAAKSMFYTVLARFRATGTMLRQSEKMAQLGTLTAGVAHELNNPAAAVKRGAAQLEDVIGAYGQARAALEALGPSEDTRAAMARLSSEVRDAGKRPDHIDALERADLEADLEDWLDDHDVPEPWEVAPCLVSLGYDTGRLDALSDDIGEPMLPAVITWLCRAYSAYTLLAEIGQGASRISDIVRALKSYSYLDQAPVQEVDVHQGLDDTLLMLRSKLKRGITVVREYADDLPRIQAYGSELNQVWTNLLDNAADALQGEGRISIRTRHDDGWVVVEIEDDGPGIPQEIQSRVFEAFYTTKPPGKGTGLGLDISYRIVVHNHRGDIKLFSRPGSTCFQVWLPVSPADADAAPGATLSSDEEMAEILEGQRTIAVVGISTRPDRPAQAVPLYLQQQGYRIIPVNPTVDEVLGEKSWPDLESVPEAVDTVLVFRPADEVPAIVDAAVAAGVKTVWMQEGILHEQAAEVARAAGLGVVMDTCMRATHRRLCS